MPKYGMCSSQRKDLIDVNSGRHLKAAFCLLEKGDPSPHFTSTVVVQKNSLAEAIFYGKNGYSEVCWIV